jgi:hypothetical protein
MQVSKVLSYKLNESKEINRKKLVEIVPRIPDYPFIYWMKQMGSKYQCYKNEYNSTISELLASCFSFLKRNIQKLKRPNGNENFNVFP